MPRARTLPAAIVAYRRPMPYRIAVIDQRLANQTAEYRYPGLTWVVGASETLEVNAATPQRLIRTWVATRAARSGGLVDLDLLAHGGGARVGEVTSVSYVVRLGDPGIYSANVEHWQEVQDLVRKIRVYTCGVESESFPAGTWTADSLASQHLLMTRLAAVTGATVKYSTNTTIGLTLSRATSTPSQSYQPDRMLEPVYRVDPAGRRTRVR